MQVVLNIVSVDEAMMTAAVTSAALQRETSGRAFITWVICKKHNRRWPAKVIKFITAFAVKCPHTDTSLHRDACKRSLEGTSVESPIKRKRVITDEELEEALALAEAHNYGVDLEAEWARWELEQYREDMRREAREKRAREKRAREKKAAAQRNPDDDGQNLTLCQKCRNDAAAKKRCRANSAVKP